MWGKLNESKGKISTNSDIRCINKQCTIHFPFLQNRYMGLV